MSTYPIMQNDSLAAIFSQEHNYDASLVGNKLKNDLIEGKVEDDASSAFDSFMEALANFFISLPWVVYVIAGMVLVALLACMLYKYRMLWGGGYKEKDIPLEDDIYEIDYDQETKNAILHGDHAQLVRLVYLSTLRSLDEAGRIAWRIYKTPSQYAREMHQDEFSKMTYHFQRVRYGKFGATPALYEQMKELQGKVLKGGES